MMADANLGEGQRGHPVRRLKAEPLSYRLLGGAMGWVLTPCL